MAGDPIQIFISYSHDTHDHKVKVRELADTLRIKYGIDVIGDFYEEDNPTGGQLPDLMEKIRICDKVICILTPLYKLKADEARGGVGYEKTIITSELYENVGSSKFIPVILDENLDFNDCIPNFLTKTRKTIVRSTFNSNDDFIDEIGRVIYQRPKNPKPPLGRNILDQMPEVAIPIEQIDIVQVIKENNHQVVFDTALFYAKQNDEHSYRALAKKVKKEVIKELLVLRDQYAISVTEDKLFEVADKFINTAAPLYLVAFAGYLSFNEKFSKQEGLLVDLLAIEGWKEYSGRTIVYHIPELLGYMYHHIYGALQIDNDDVSRVLDIFEQKIPLNSSNYDYLYKVKSVTGWIDSLGKDCFKSFDYLINSYEKWSWLRLIFADVGDFRKALLTYQIMINLLDYFNLIKADCLFEDNSQISYCHIPPSAAIGDRQDKEYALNYLVKNDKFFKNYIQQLGISKDKLKSRWKLWLKEISKFNRMDGTYLYIYEEKFIDNLLD
ncbi:toll/interleukin-1 receptor domain-containing protein [Legionella cincinnatiensis]|uniref:SEFIR domain n=1 Tax=Legionella cincinnatiensis TaxID=28085 RepID=A0A378IH58_9GAMM|nr:toll/interleukin-1 receptor domain-containing protein [Legionella cincinnatiensis]KTC93588.1 SEFIR domain protein [Legionella cincinnatiensis]STX34082.1 SEFIR domain [Legionella cincinnatiensis]